MRTVANTRIFFAALLALATPGVLPFAGAQVNPSKTSVAGEPVVIPYAVSTVRESKGPPLPQFPVATMTESVGHFSATYASLRHLIGHAYSLQDSRIVEGATWLDSKHFDIIAKSDEADNAVPNALTDDLKHKYNLRQLQLLLEDRFFLKMHTEQREIPVFALVVAKGGPKMRPSDDKSSLEKIGVHDLPNSGLPGIRGVGTGRFISIGISMDQLANYIASHAAGEIDRPVENMTGLTGLYDFQLKWTPGLGTTSDQPNDARLDLFTSIQEQLGLKLEPRKSSMEVLVIDHVEMPTPN